MWAEEADAKRPWRAEIRGVIADAVRGAGARSVLELGSGPGLLAARVREVCGDAIDRYVLLDFSPPMLEMSRARVAGWSAAHFVLADFKQPGWTDSMGAPVDVAVTMQAVHELRHKRYAAGLYREVRAVLQPGGLVLVCDHAPPDASARSTTLHATVDEQHAALADAGFVDVEVVMLVRGMYVLRASAALVR